MDRDGITLLLEPIKGAFARLKHVWLDAGYIGAGQGQGLGRAGAGLDGRHRAPPAEAALRVGAAGTWSRTGTAILPPPGFRVLPRRWVVERTFSWLGQSRRLSKDYERLCATSEALIYIAMTRLMVRRLAAS